MIIGSWKDDMDRGKDSIHKVPFWIGPVTIVLFCGIFGFVFLIDGILPSALNINDEENYPESFITERAVADLKFLTDLGPKVTGSYENEYNVIEFLILKIKTIAFEAHSSQFIEFDVQIVTGGYYLDDMAGYMNVYDKVQNVVVKLHGQSNASGHSILINSHFDTVPISPGGCDDGINVVNMLEILRKLSKSEVRQQHSIIFLFNGAEETPLQAAHGYITHHKWANESKLIVNLESAGAEGKLILFQSGPECPWLLKYYAKVPHPYGSVLAEEIFQSGLIPSDTDFRIFRDFGDMVGVDMAYFKNGYRYHTKYDAFSNIPVGSYQHGGDNTLALVKSLANAPEVLEIERSKGKAIFFDIFGWFMISYNRQSELILNSVIICISFGVFILSLIDFRVGLKTSVFKYFVFTFLTIIFSWLITSAFVISVAFLLDILNKTMSWYGQPWLIFGLYIVPIIGLSGCLLFITNHRYIYFQNLSLGVRSQIQAHLLRIIWTIVLLVGTILNIRSSYMIMLLVTFHSFGFLIIHIFRLQNTVRTWQIVNVSSLIIPITYVIYRSLTILESFIPISGRSGSESNPELFIAAICLLFGLMAVSSLTVLTNLMRCVIWYYLILLAVFVAFFGMIYSPLGFPYSGDNDAPKPQRHWIMHAHRQFFNENSDMIRSDSGIVMLNMDRNSPNILKSYVKELADKASIEDDCDKYTLCAIPLIHAKVVERIQYSTWIPIGEPSFPTNETLMLSVLSKEQLSSTQIRYNIEVSGPDKLMFYITPRSDMTFVSTSLIDIVKPIKFNFKGRPVYIILYQLGKGDGTPLTFTITMETPYGYSGITLDFAVSARYVHEHRVSKTAAYLQFLNEFPDWAHPTAWVAAYQSYVL